MTLGADHVVLLGAGAAVLAVVVLVLVLAPWKGVRNERPLDDDVETRLLLGEDPGDIAADIDEAEAQRAEVHDLDASRADAAEHD